MGLSHTMNACLVCRFLRCDTKKACHCTCHRNAAPTLPPMIPVLAILAACSPIRGAPSPLSGGPGGGSCLYQDTGYPVPDKPALAPPPIGEVHQDAGNPGLGQTGVSYVTLSEVNNAVEQLQDNRRLEALAVFCRWSRGYRLRSGLSGTNAGQQQACPRDTVGADRLVIRRKRKDGVDVPTSVYGDPLELYLHTDETAFDCNGYPVLGQDWYSRNRVAVENEHCLWIDRKDGVSR
jgi:hypothetical protein